MLRTVHLDYATAFMDETFNILYGRMYFAGQFRSMAEEPLNYHYGWYLWPILSAVADHFGGLVAARYLTAVLGMLTVLGVYGFARRVFSPEVGLAAAAIFAFLGPAVFNSRFATYDGAAVCFLALGLWCYAIAWERNQSAAWFLAVLFLFAGFLSKYLVAIFFPPLVLLSLRKSRNAFFTFTLPLALFCATYAWVYRSVLANVVDMIARENESFTPTSQILWEIYGRARLDLWILVALSFLAFLPLGREREKSLGRSELWKALLLWCGALLMVGLQLRSSAAHLRFFKHVTYTMVFLAPLGAEGLRRVFVRLRSTSPNRYWAAAIAVLVVVIGWAGQAWSTERLVFWSSLEPALAFFAGRVGPQTRILTDDVSFSYYLHPPVAAWNITNAYYFPYRGQFGPPAYALAVDDGYFDYVALDDAFGPEPTRLRQAIEPRLSARYALRVKAKDPVLSKPIRIYERVQPPARIPPDYGIGVEILSPANGTTVQTQGMAASLKGRVRDAQAGWTLRAEVYTNKWYPQGEAFAPAADGSFQHTIYLGGPCEHFIRVRLLDENGKQRAVASSYGVLRANPDGSAPKCP
ncbi:MAG TPA: glycosyltransferase family 39 protein [Candidatus Nitrosotenuis sp.]|nr:glycosyltransferase family 39 protein [Candidatus Nitrosotenuis sp.]